MKRIFLLSFAIIMVTGCGSTKTGGGIIEPTVSNKKEKDWIDIESEKDKQFLYIKASAKGTDRNYLKEVVIKSIARTNIAAYIYASAREELDNAIGPNSSYGTSIQNSLAEAKYSGILLKDSFWKIVDQSGGKTTYEQFGWFSIPLDEITKAKARAWNASFTDDKLSNMDIELRNKLAESKKRFLQNN